MPLTLGQQLDGNRYTILAKLGQGGAGSVYKVQDNRAVPGMPLTLALKEISVAAIPDPVDREDSAAAFRSEVRLLMSLNHPYLTQVVNFFAENDNYYLVMDFVDGETLLKARERANRPLPVNQVLDWFWQLCDVLVYLHGLDPPIIFRDLKPGNIMVTRQDGTVKLIDFGIARFFKKEGAAADTRALGTPGYAPPEQYGRSQTDERSDIYSLGVTIYELLTNVNPDEHIFNLPPPLTLNPAIPPTLAAMLVKMTQLEPEARYQTIIAVRSDLAKIYPKPVHPTPPQTQRILNGQAPPATPPPPPEPSPSQPQLAQAAPAPVPTPSPSPVRAIPAVDERYLATPAPLPTERKVTAPPASPARPTAGGQAQQPARARRSPLPTIVLALALVAVIVGGSYFGLLPFSLPFIGTASHTPAPDTLYPATIAAPAGVANPALNSRSPRGQWWMPGYDWGGTNFSHESGPTIAGTSLWDFPINAPTDASSNLIVANEGYYLIEPSQSGPAGSSIALYLDASGQPAWSFDLPPGPLEFNRLAYAKGGNATFLYLQDSVGDIYASDPAAQGRATWRYSIGSAMQYAPVVANGMLYATTPLTITALDAATGKQLWQDPAAFSSALLLSPDAASLYRVRNGRLTALDPVSGTVKWQSDPLPGATISATHPLLATQNSIYMGTASGLVIPFDAGNGGQLSQFSVGGEIVGFAAAGNTLYVTVSGSNSVTARDAASGFERWSYPLSGEPGGAPVIVGDDLYILSKDGKLTILNARSGTLLKSISLPDTPRGDGEYVNSTFYYFGGKGLHALR